MYTQYRRIKGEFKEIDSSSAPSLYQSLLNFDFQKGDYFHSNISEYYWKFDGLNFEPYSRME